VNLARHARQVTLVVRRHCRRRIEIPEAERRVVLCRRLLGIGPNPSTKDAELIAFRVDPRRPLCQAVSQADPSSGQGLPKLGEPQGRRS
jgi:hypothetical protein